MTLTRVGLLAVALFAAGCQSKLHDERTLNLDVGSIRTILIDAPRYDQQVVVTMTANADVTIAAYLKKNQSAVEAQLERNSNPSAVLAFQENVRNTTLNLTVPGKEDWVVRVQSDKSAATVKLSIKGS